MKKLWITMLIALFSLSLCTLAIAESETHNEKEFTFGTNYHKDPGIKINYLQINWDENGITSLRHNVSALKQKIKWDDLLFVGEKDGKKQILFRHSSKRNYEPYTICYLECLHKAVLETLFFDHVAQGFDRKNGEVWYIFRNPATNKVYHIVWTLADNSLAWYKAEDKPLPQ